MSPRNPVVDTPQAGLSGALLLVEIVELKWLLSGHGIRLHVEQLQSDPQYARTVLVQARALPNDALRGAAERVRRGLGLTLESAPAGGTPAA